MQYRLTPLVLAALVTVAACSDDDDDPTGNEGNATVRVVNASPTNATVSLANGTTTLANTVGFGATVACVNVPAGSRTLTFRSGATDIASTTATNFTANTDYTVVLSGSDDATTATVLTDNFTAPTAGNHAIRFVNATDAAGDVYLTTADAEVAAPATSANLTAGASTAYASFPNTDVRARLFAVGSTETPTADVAITGLASNVGTVFFTPAATEGGPTGFVVAPCD